MNGFGLLALLAVTVGARAQGDLGGGWRAEGGEWAWTRDVHSMLLQRAAEGEARAVRTGLQAERTVWRCVAEPGLGATEVEFAFACDEGLTRGLVIELGGSETGGLVLKAASGEVLWEDRWALWQAYEAYVLEGVIEGGHVRAQMLEADAKTLVSQGDWVAVPAESLAQSGCVVLRTRNSRARFWGVEAADQPLSPLTEDAPNKRRLWQGPEGEWNVPGPGNWMWTDAGRQRMRQFANVERAWAIDRKVTGRDRLWQAAVRVHEPAGGAGIMVKSDDTGESGLLAWLGGKFGAGCLMIYRHPGDALWASAQDKWHYEEDLLLQVETQGAQLRARLLAADGKTTIAESPWVALTEAEAQREGCLAFHTWRGSAEFWGFAEGAPAGLAQAPGEASRLGAEWLASPTGTVEWAGEGQTALRLAGDEAWCLSEGLTGARGVWKCSVVVTEGARAAGLLAQAGRDLKEGFWVVLEPGKLTLQDLGLEGKARWEDAACQWKAGTTYTLEAKVMTDRLSLRLLDADSGQVISESPAVYVSDRNNDREGRLGMWVKGGEARFSAWAMEKE